MKRTKWKINSMIMANLRTVPRQRTAQTDMFGKQSMLMRYGQGDGAETLCGTGNRMEWPDQKHSGVVHVIGMQFSIDGTEAIE
jgi:hypothetical protein